MLNAADLQTYSAYEVANLADVDFYAVRDEGFRRQAIAEKALARAERALAKARGEMNQAAAIITAALREQAKVA